MTKRHERLVQLLIEERKARNIRQEQLARALRQQQSWVSRLESGQRRIDVVEFLMLAEVIGFDPYKMLRRVHKGARRRACMVQGRARRSRSLSDAGANQMTAEKLTKAARWYRKAIDTLGMTQVDAAVLLGVDPRTSRRWANAERDIPEPVVRFLNYLITTHKSGEQAMAVLGKAA